MVVKQVLLHAGGFQQQSGCEASLLPRKGSAEGKTASHASKVTSLTPTSHATADPKEDLLLGEVGVRAWGHDSQTWIKLVSSHPDCPMLPAHAFPALCTNVPCQDRPFWVSPSLGGFRAGCTRPRDEGQVWAAWCGPLPHLLKRI